MDNLSYILKKWPSIWQAFQDECQKELEENPYARDYSEGCFLEWIDDLHDEVVADDITVDHLCEHYTEEGGWTKLFDNAEVRDDVKSMIRWLADECKGNNNNI